MKTVVFSIATGGYKSLYAGCIATHRRYCRKHGYTSVLVDRVPFRMQASDSSWLKIPLILQALNTGCSWVFAVDADCEIRAHAPRLETLTEPGKRIFLAPGRSGKFNSGVIIAQNSPEAVGFFRTIMEAAERPVPEEDFAPYENGHVNHFALRDPAVKKIDHAWNNNSKLDPSAFIQHYCAGLREGYLACRPSVMVRLGRKVLRKVRRLWTPPAQPVKETLVVEGTLPERLERCTEFCREVYPVFRSATPASGVR